MTTLPVAENRSETIPTSTKNEPTAVLITEKGAYIGLNEAKRRTGKSKDTILRHAEKGTISTILNEQGRKVYQVVDLERVFGFQPEATSRVEDAHDQSDQPEQDETSAIELALLRERLRHTEELNRVYLEQAQRAEREAQDWKQQAAQAMRMLSYQPQTVAQDQNNQPDQTLIIEQTPTATEPKRGFFGRLFGGGNG